MDFDEKMPLPPEVKINMTLDQIIKHEKIRCGISHVMQPKKRPYFYRRRKSQNWRLRGNGPNTPRYRNYWRSYAHRERTGKVRAFLERKYRTAPPSSVFHRLGWTPAQSAAVNKLWVARNYQRPQRFLPYWKNNFFKKPYQTASNPFSLQQKIAATNMYYKRYNGLSGAAWEGTPSLSLNKMNLEKLTQAVGSPITCVKEQQSDTGSIITIETINTPAMRNKLGMSGGGYGNTPLNNNSARCSSDSINGMNQVPNDLTITVDNSNRMPPLQQQGTMPPLYQSNGMPPLVQHYAMRPMMQQSSVPIMQNNHMALQRPWNQQKGGPGIDNVNIAIHATTVPCTSRFSDIVPLSSEAPRESMDF